MPLALVQELGEMYPKLLGDFSKKWIDDLNNLRVRKDEILENKPVAERTTEKIEYWRKAVNLTYPDKSEQWEKYLYDFQISPEKVDTTISIMERLEEGKSFEDVFKEETKNLLNSKDDTTKREASKKLYTEIWGAMLFSKRGVEFFEYYTAQLYLQFGIDESDILYRQRERIEKIREINAKNEREGIDSGKTSPEEIERRKNDKKIAKEAVKKMNNEIDDFDEV